MKTCWCFLLFLGTLVSASAQTNNDQAIRDRMMAWVAYGSSGYGSVLSFELFAKRASWGMGQQFFAANVRNAVSYKLRVQGELYAKLICGNEAVSKFDFTIDSYGSLKKAEMGSMNVSYLSDATGLISSADKEECAGNDIIIGGKKYGVSRIQALGIRNVKVEAQMGRGGDWLPMRSNGTFVEPAPARQSSGNTSGNTVNQPSGSAEVRQSGSGSTPRMAQAGGQDRSSPTSSRTGSQTGNWQQNTVSDAGAAQRSSYQSGALSDLQRAQQSGQSAITQQMHLSNAMISARASGDAATIQQIEQYQAQISAQRQQQLTQATTELAGSIANIISHTQARNAERAAAAERLRREREANRLRRQQMEQERANQEQREKEKAAAEKARQYQLDVQILSGNERLLKLSTVSAGIDSVYFLGYERSYAPGADRALRLKTFMVYRYSDRSFPLLADIVEKTSFPDYYDARGITRLLGYYPGATKLQAAIQQIQNQARQLGISTNVDDEEIRINNRPSATKREANFWDQ